MLLISCNVHYKSLQLETRKGCSNVRLLLVDGREVDFEHSHLIDKDVAELLVEGSWTDRGQAEIEPVLKSVVVAKDLWPVLPIHLNNTLVRTRNKV